jgi:hypothetical protein
MTIMQTVYTRVNSLRRREIADYLINSLKQSPWKSNNLTVARELSKSLWNSKALYRVCKWPLPSTVPNHINSINLVSSSPRVISPTFRKCKLYQKLRFWVFTAVTLKNTVFRDIMMSCGSCKNRRFGGIYCLHLHGEIIWISLVCSEAIPHDGRGREPLAPASPLSCLCVTVEIQFY